MSQWQGVTFTWAAKSVRQETAVTCTARRTVSRLRWFDLHLLRTSGSEQRTRHDVLDCHDQQTRLHVVGEAESHGTWGPTRLHGVWAVPTPCVNQRPPRPVQTGGDRGATPLSTQLCLWVGPIRWGGQAARRLPGRCSSVAASPLRCRTGLLVGCSTAGRQPPGVLR